MIIGLTGKMGSGKDTVADHLVAHYGFRKVGFSDELYAGICALWGISLEEALEYKQHDVLVAIRIPWDGAIPSNVLGIHHTWRAHLQRFGTEMGRHAWGADFWVERFEQKYIDPLSDEEFEDVRLVVRDVRFNNEAKCLGDFGGTIWQVHRPEHDGDSHESEAGIHVGHIDGDIYNDGTQEELYPILDKWMEECFGSQRVSKVNSND